MDFKHAVKRAVDIRANDGTFSELLASLNIYTISVDSDQVAINNLYNRVKHLEMKQYIHCS